ncbi:hypothetical protein [Loigolactobacillus rennini]|uniref:hypothetical protein n=1 Tax=Loigolactobacillus rennini TaxID=238013 RepID=UPI00070CAE25|nr:hypothetical protein [Loigolactobacillus rennini]
MSEEPCIFCGKYTDCLLEGTVVTDGNEEDLVSVDIEGHRLVLNSWENGELSRRDIDYCPICGRKLWEE